MTHRRPPPTQRHRAQHPRSQLPHARAPGHATGQERALM